MWQKILVAVDLSPISKKVFEQALNLAKATEASLILLHVLSAYEKDAPPQLLYPLEDPILPEVWQTIVAEHEKQWQIFQDKGVTVLNAMKSKAIELKIETEVIQIFGSPEHRICEQAEKLAVDLIMIGNRGLSGIKEIFLGSVSNYVMHHASCSVLVVKIS